MKSTPFLTPSASVCKTKSPCVTIVISVSGKDSIVARSYKRPLRMRSGSQNNDYDDNDFDNDDDYDDDDDDDDGDDDDDDDNNNNKHHEQ